MDDLLELHLLGITYNQIESGVYAVLLQEAGGPRRLPIIIGYPEAQSIECRLQGVHTPRPLSHDVMASVITSLGASLDHIVIHRLPNGVFAATLILVDSDGREVKVDSRSSDAIALSLRFGSKIYTSPQLLDEAGFTPEKSPEDYTADDERPTRNADRTTPADDAYERMGVAQLQAELEKCVAREEYELAARIKAILDRKS